MDNVLTSTDLTTGMASMPTGTGSSSTSVTSGLTTTTSFSMEASSAEADLATTVSSSSSAISFWPNSTGMSLLWAAAKARMAAAN